MTATGFKPKPFSSKTNTQPFSQTGQMIELCRKFLSVRCIWLYVLIMSRTCFWVNLISIVAWMSRKSLLEKDNIWRLSDRSGIRNHNHLVHNRTLNVSQTRQMIELCCEFNLALCSYHVTHAFFSESILHSCLNVKELLSSKCSLDWLKSAYVTW